MLRRFFFFFILYSQIVHALPISFSRNEGALKYDEIVSDHFYFYGDHEVPSESLLLFNSLESAVPKLEKWFGQELDDPILGVSSSVTLGASFANFFANTIELQTLGRGGRDLVWHELTHMFMYRKFEYNGIGFFFGHSSPILQLIWTPVWFIEGLAEALSRSVGSSKTASIERYQALSGDWPTYDELHSLYDGDGFAERGYATSGAFVTWLFTKKKSEILPVLLEDIKKYTLPWFVLLAFNPFGSFLPMDYSLQIQFKKKGRKLYDDYKKEAKTYWEKVSKDRFFVSEKTDKIFLKKHRSTFVHGNKAYLIAERKYKIQKQKLVFDKKTGWLIGLRPYGPVYDKWFKPEALLKGSHDSFNVQYDRDFKYGTLTNKLFKISDKEETNFLENKEVFYEPKGSISHIYQTKNKVIWFEIEKGKSKFCSSDKLVFMRADKLKEKDKNCFLEKNFPESTHIVGTEDEPDFLDPDIIRSIWYVGKKETLKGEQSELFRLDPETNIIDNFSYPYGGEIKKIVRSREGYLLLVSTLSRQIIMSTNRKGLCLRTYQLNDYILDLNTFEDGNLILSFYKGEDKAVKKLALSSLEAKPCSYYKPHDSPLLFASRQRDKIPSLHEALEGSSYHKTDKLAEKPEENKEEKRTGTVQTKFSFKTKKGIKPSKLRIRPLFYLPLFLNQDSTLELGIGIFSIPFMDHLQNHQVWLSAFWNFKTHPNFSVEYRLTRFWPTLLFSVFRRVKWNGFETDLVSLDEKFFATRRSSYVSEIGGGVHINYKFYTKRTTSSLTGSLSLTTRKDLTKVKLLHDKTIEGLLFKPSLSLSHLIKFESFSLAFGVKGNYIPSILGSKFHYNNLGFDLALLKPLDFLKSSVSFALSGARTRGEKGKIPILRQYYTALKIYIPSGGSGFSDTSYRLLGPNYLFYPLTGDDKVRAEFKWKIPVIAHIKKLWWILFLRSLDFTTIINYGGIWDNGRFDIKKLNFAHAYNLDLHLGNKGVNLYGGVGAGQLIDMSLGKPQATSPALYVRFGFQALF